MSINFEMSTDDIIKALGKVDGNISEIGFSAHIKSARGGRRYPHKSMKSKSKQCRNVMVRVKSVSSISGYKWY